MTDREGVVKYQLDYTEDAPPPAELAAPLTAWRGLLLALGLVGRDPARYHGLGFGNLSRRLPADGANAFLITGTQTGHLAHLGPEHYARVLEADVTANRIRARGPVPPSSEALTHAAIYAAAPECHWIFHGHAPALWTRHAALGLPATPADVEYGTPAMARAVAEQVHGGRLRVPEVLVMLGHEDGVVAVGRSADEAGGVLVEALARAGEREALGQ